MNMIKKFINFLRELFCTTPVETCFAEEKTCPTCGCAPCVCDSIPDPVEKKDEKYGDPVIEDTLTSIEEPVVKKKRRGRPRKKKVVKD